MMEETSFSLRWTVWASSVFTLSRSDTASWVSLRSPSTLRLNFSTSALDFFSRSRVSSHSSRDCSSFPLTLLRWLHLSSAVWMSSSVFCLDSPVDFFSLPSFPIRSPWWLISSRRVRIWESLVFLSGLASGLLLLTKLTDKITLVAYLIAKSTDLGVLGVLVLLALLDGCLQVLDLFPETSGLSRDLASSLLDPVDSVIFGLDPGLCLIHLSQGRDQELGGNHREVRGGQEH